MAWAKIATAPTDGNMLLWARQCGFPNEQLSLYIGWWTGKPHGSSVNGELMVGWRGVSFDDMQEDAVELIPTHWMLPDGPSTL